MNNVIYLIFCALSVVFVLWLIWYELLRKWVCKECGTVVRGTTGKNTGFRFTGGYCENCCFQTITHAQYLRRFGAGPSLKSVHSSSDKSRLNEERWHVTDRNMAAVAGAASLYYVLPISAQPPALTDIG